MKYEGKAKLNSRQKRERPRIIHDRLYRTTHNERLSVPRGFKNTGSLSNQAWVLAI